MLHIPVSWSLLFPCVLNNCSNTSDIHVPCCLCSGNYNVPSALVKLGYSFCLFPCCWVSEECFQFYTQPRHVYLAICAIRKQTRRFNLTIKTAFPSQVKEDLIEKLQKDVHRLSKVSTHILFQTDTCIITQSFKLYVFALKSFKKQKSRS